MLESLFNKNTGLNFQAEPLLPLHLQLPRELSVGPDICENYWCQSLGYTRLVAAADRSGTTSLQL